MAFSIIEKKTYINLHQLVYKKCDDYYCAKCPLEFITIETRRPCFKLDDRILKQYKNQILDALGAVEE